MDPAVSPDGESITFTRHGSSQSEADIYKLELTSELQPAGEPQRVVSGTAVVLAAGDRPRAISADPPRPSRSGEASATPIAARGARHHPFTLPRSPDLEQNNT
jgi:hypothetical protein